MAQFPQLVKNSSSFLQPHVYYCYKIPQLDSAHLNPACTPKFWGKLKLFHYTPQRLLGKEVELLLILDLGIRWGSVVSVTTRPHFRPGERTPGTHCTGRWVGPRTGLDTEATIKLFRLCQGSNLDRPVVQPVVRHYAHWHSTYSKSIWYCCLVKTYDF
jgi:hypothetical protein